MARYLTNIDLTGQALQNALLHPNAGAPTALGNGQVYYDTTGHDFWGRVNGNWREFAMVGLPSANIDHGNDLAGLTDDDHTQYALLAGRSGGQTLYGSTVASENLILGSTSNVTKGYIDLLDTTRLTTSATTTFNTAGVQFVLRATGQNDEMRNVAVTGTASSSTFLRGDGTWSTPAGGYSNWNATADSGGPDVVNDGDTIDWAGGDAISTVMTGGGTAAVTITSNLVYTGAGTNFIDFATNLEGTAINSADTIAYHDATDETVKKGLVSDLPFVTSVGITDGDLIDSSGGPITDSGNITINVDLTELTNMAAAIDGTQDRLVVLDNNVTQHSKLINTIPLSEFNNDSGWTSNAGTVTNVNSGNGLDFTDFTVSGTITLGLPGSTTGTSTNAVTATSHTHALDLTGASSTELDDTANIVYTNAARTISVTHTIATGNDLIITDAPTSNTHAANKGYVDSVAQGLDAKQSVRAATTTAGTLASSFENGDIIDGVTLATNDRILIKNQSAAAENGIYTVNATGAPTRATDADTWDELVSAFVFVEEGTNNKDTGWVCLADAGGTLGTTAVDWAQFSGAGTYSDGDGILLTGTVFSVDLNTNSGLTFATNQLTLGTPTAVTGSSTNSVSGTSHTHAVTTGITSGALLESSGGTSGQVAFFSGTGIQGETTLSASRGGTGIAAASIGDGQILIGHNANNNWTAAVPTAAATTGTGAVGTALNWNPSAGALSINAIAASETVSGVIELATQAEVDATTLGGNYQYQAITPATLRGTPDQSANYTAGGSNTSTRKYVKGTNAGTETQVTHNFGTREVIVQVFDATTYDTVYPDIDRPTTNRVDVNFNASVTANEYIIVIIG